MEDIKQVLKGLLYLIIGITFIITIVYNLNHKFRLYEKDCGTLYMKSYEDIVIKHGTRTELYLIVETKNQGLRSKEVGITEYMTTEIGDLVCMDIYVNQGDYHEVYMIIGAFFMVAIVIVALGSFLYWLFD